MRLIDLPENWEHGKEFIRAGAYRVPEDMSEELAAKAIAEAGATEIATAGASEPEPEPAPAPKRGGRKALKGAPDNKMLTGAPEDKDGAPFKSSEGDGKAEPPSSRQADQA